MPQAKEVPVSSPLAKCLFLGDFELEESSLRFTPSFLNIRLAGNTISIEVGLTSQEPPPVIRNPFKKRLAEKDSKNTASDSPNDGPFTNKQEWIPTDPCQLCHVERQSDETTDPCSPDSIPPQWTHSRAYFRLVWKNVVF